MEISLPHLHEPIVFRFFADFDIQIQPKEIAGFTTQQKSLLQAIAVVETGALTLSGGLPWYLRPLELSRPLHFGDYGGLPLKVIWGLVDVMLIVVLLSGLYLWLPKRKSPLNENWITWLNSNRFDRLEHDNGGYICADISDPCQS